MEVLTISPDGSIRADLKDVPAKTCRQYVNHPVLLMLFLHDSFSKLNKARGLSTKVQQAFKCIVIVPML